MSHNARGQTAPKKLKRHVAQVRLDDDSGWAFRTFPAESPAGDTANG